MKKHFKYIAAAFFLSGMLSAQTIDLNKMPAPGPTPVIKIAQPKTFTLKNGLTVMVVENHKLPRVNMNLAIDRPPVYEGEISGVGDLMASQLDNGTLHLSKDEFNKKIDYLGASLNFHAKGASANTLSKYFPQVLDLMADAITSPKFSEKEIQDAKERTIEGLKADEKNASSIASNVSNALMYGKNTARGEFSTIESVQKITPADVQDAYKKYYTPNNAYLVVVGDVSFSKIKPMIERAFAGWKKSDTKFTPLEPANNLATTEINVVDVPTAVQSVISVGNLNDLKMNDKQYFSAMLGNYILGGGSESRLFMNLREKNGFTYGAYSSMNPGKYSSDFSAGASVRNEVADKAVKEFMNELNAISNITPQELANAKAKLKGDFIRSMEKPETIARFALNQKVQNLPADFYNNYLKSIDAVTIADVQNAVKSNIYPNQGRIFVAGKGSAISDNLEKLGYPVKYFDRFANPVAKPSAQKIDASLTAASIAQKYLEAIGGTAAVSKINSITTDASAKVQEMDLALKMIQAKGGKSLVDLKMMGNTVQKIVFDGRAGYMEAQGKKTPLPQKLVDEMAKSAELFPELNFSKNGAAVVGIEKFGGEESYVVKSGSSTYYYSVKTELKTGDVKTAGGQTIPTTYAEYKEVAGVKMPYKFIQNMGGTDVEMNVTSYQVNQAKDTDFK